MKDSAPPRPYVLTNDEHWTMTPETSVHPQPDHFVL